ncbi:MAG: DUF2934 domain-containing protein [Nitrospira sp.]|nr:DUF2934 domain-containing protein [Nitrospira sp.]MBX7038771.1 DUF2934 domain-containing protein [Nitrospira sp.]MCW5793756.1 DUF2934 domain-containing protein [Nitrospira sp.]HMU30062.1 DUF2934 domain-containing protein [Nitrospira sp.]HMW86321.1 DUF2934 domain-containing protein [Nitrospira sp.]
MKRKEQSRAAAPPSPRAKEQTAVNPSALPDGMWERISQKAYDLWRERGSREGFALEDWLDAEAIVMEEMHESRE